MSESYYQQFGVGQPAPPPEPSPPPGMPAHRADEGQEPVPLHGVADPSELTDPHLPVVDPRVHHGQQTDVPGQPHGSYGGYGQFGAPGGQQYIQPGPSDGFGPQAGPRHGAPDHFAGGGYAPRQDVRQRLQTADLVDQHKPVPTRGWRKAVHKAIGANPGLSKSERDWNELQGRTRRDLRGTFFIVVMADKGGPGKTTSTMGLGCALAEQRKDYVLAMDINPASGTLQTRVDRPSQGNIRSLNADRKLASYTDAHYHMGINTSSGLEILDGVRDDFVLTGGEVREAWRRASRFYPIGLGDCGTQLQSDVNAVALGMADALVVVSSTRIDGVRSAENTLDWLSQHGHEALVRSGTVLINDPYRETDPKKVEKMKSNFAKWVRKVHYIPFDPHLTEADTIDFKRLKGPTRRAYIEAAASVVDLFAAAADKDYTGQPRAGLGRHGGEVV